MAPGSRPDVDAQKCADVSGSTAPPLVGQPGVRADLPPRRPGGQCLYGKEWGELDWSLSDLQGRREGKVL